MNLHSILSNRSNIDSFIAMDVVAKANELSAQGKDVISMAVGQPAALAPSVAREAARLQLETGPIGYTDANGRRGLRHRISRYYEEHYGVETDPSRIVVTTGSSAGFILAFLSWFDEGSRIAIPSPGYPAYRNIIKALSMVPVEIETDHDSGWTLNAELLEQAHKSETIDGLLFANPNNPNGTMLAQNKFKALLEKAQELNIRFISDEIYHGLTYTEEETCALNYSDEVIVINSFSKFFCMTGWRIGWMIVPENLLGAIDRLQQNLFICAPEISQVAAEAAFDGMAELIAVREGYRKNRELFLKRLPEIGINEFQPIDGAFYAYGNISNHSDNSMALAEEWLNHCLVAATPGLDFDTRRGESWMRFSFAGDYERMSEGFDRIADWLSKK